MDKQICHQLPIELVRQIFELAAVFSRRSCLDLCLVASWARDIASPHLCHTVLLDNHRAISTFKDTSEWGVARIERLAPLIRNVWAANLDRESVGPLSEELLIDVHDIFAQFTQAREVVLDSRSMIFFFRGILRSNWVWEPRPYFQITFADQVIAATSHLRNLSNLRIRMATNDSDRRFWDYDRLAGLTHFSVPYYDLSQVHRPKRISELLRKDGFKMIVIEIVETMPHSDRMKIERWIRMMRKKDKRIFLLRSRPYNVRRFQEQWEMELRSGGSFWERAVRFTAEWEGWAEQLVILLQPKNSAVPVESQ